MDNPTHLLTGYFMSRAGLNRLTPHATAILLISSNIPDIDIVALAGGGVNYLHWHRYWTHAFVVAPLMALASVAIVRAFARKPLPWVWATFVALLGVISHLLLDWTNQYGIRFLLPFSQGAYRLDNAMLFDLWIYSAFAVCLFAPLLARLVGGEIGARPRATAGQGWAIVALLFLGVYFAGRGVIHGRMIRRTQRADLQRRGPSAGGGFSDVRIAFPVAGCRGDNDGLACLWAEFPTWRFRSGGRADVL